MPARIGKSMNRLLLSVLSTAALIVIGYLDWLTGYEFSLSLLYLVPVFLLALHKDSGLFQIILNSFLSALVWIVADLSSGHVYTHWISPYWEAFARFIIFLVVSLLIYRLRKEHDKLTRSNENLQKLNAEKNTFMGYAAHDLRNPLTSILGFSEILLHGRNRKPEELDQILKMIREAASKSLKLIANLLDISRIENGTVNAHLQPAAYMDFVKHCLDLNHFLAADKDIEMKLETDGSNPYASIDKVYFEEVINNLLSNAIKYSFPGSRIDVKIRSTDVAIHTEITDHGVGIDKAETGKLFQPFQRASSRPTAGETSTGLGLAIAKRIITLHQGSIGISSERNTGTTVYFDIPRVITSNGERFPVE